MNEVLEYNPPDVESDFTCNTGPMYMQYMYMQYMYMQYMYMQYIPMYMQYGSDENFYIYWILTTVCPGAWCNIWI